jgi:hypothetical protein
MNTTIKLGIASALSLGAVAAHAQIAANSSGASTVILFAEVVNSSGTAVASYAENTGVSVTSAYNGVTTLVAADANFSALLTADAAGDTLYWGVEGGQYTGNNTITNQSKAGATMNVSTAANPSQIPTLGSSVLAAQNTVLASTISSLNSNLAGANSIEGANPSSAGVWDVTGGNQIYNWNGATPVSAITGLSATGTSVALYDMTGTGSAGTKLALVSNTNVSLTAAGLQFTTNAPAVPLPPAVWLLGGGLLGLAGVGRRKALKA